MAFENFFTSQATGQNTGAFPGAAKGKKSSKVLGSNNAFLEMMLVRMTQQAEQSGRGNIIMNGEDAATPLTASSKDMKLDMLTILADNPEIEQELQSLAETFSLDLNEKIAHVLHLNQMAAQGEQAVNALSVSGADLTDLETQPLPNLFSALLLQMEGENSIDLNQLQTMLNKLRAMANKGNPLLITADLSPEQITELQGRLASLSRQLKELEPDNGIAVAQTPAEQQDVAPLVAATAAVSLVAPRDGKVDLNALPANVVILPQQAGKQKGQKGPVSADLLARMNAMVSGQPIPARSGNTAFSFDDLMYGRGAAPQGNAPGSGNADNAFSGAIKNAAQAMANGAAAGAQASANAGPAGPALVAAGHVLQSWPFGSSGSLYAPMGWGEIPLDDLGLNTAGMSTGTQGALTSLVTQAQNAGQPHPATQVVISAMRKAGAKGQDQTMRLLLDPPEMGRVEIRMHFSKDKTMKALVIAEKPETFVMLQRDAATLERALQDIGLDTQDGLSFELADEDHAFSHDGSHDGSNGGQNGKGDNASGLEDEMEIIESTMTWHVDPETGHMRYNIMA